MGISRTIVRKITESPKGPTLSATNRLLKWVMTSPIDLIGLSIISGTWPNCTVQAIPGGPLEDFGPFADAAEVEFSTLPQCLDSLFFWGDSGYAYYAVPQNMLSARRVLRYLHSDTYVDTLYVGAEQLTINGDPVAAIFGASI